MALNLEWLNMGELRNLENDHAFAAYLNPVGANGVGLFYLEMRRGLDILAQNPNLDRSRLGARAFRAAGGKPSF